MTPSVPRALFALLSILLTSGCSNSLETDYSDLNLATVSGMVTLDDEPLAGARVIFESADLTYSYGVTDSSGSYSLMFNSEQEGVTPGDKIVRISMGSALEESETGEGDESESDGEVTASEIRIPERYNRDSELTEVVEPGSQTIDFELSSTP